MSRRILCLSPQAVATALMSQMERWSVPSQIQYDLPDAFPDGLWPAMGLDFGHDRHDCGAETGLIWLGPVLRCPCKVHDHYWGGQVAYARTFAPHFAEAVVAHGDNDHPPDGFELGTVIDAACVLAQFPAFGSLRVFNHMKADGTMSEAFILHPRIGGQRSIAVQYVAPEYGGHHRLFLRSTVPVHRSVGRA